MFQTESYLALNVCPNCHKIFLQKRRNKIFCSKQCHEQYNAERLAKDSYHRKYRSLLQRYNAIVNADELNPEAHYKYKEWQIWASKELKKIQKLIQDDKPEIESPDDFAKRLKGYWNEIYKYSDHVTINQFHKE